MHSKPASIQSRKFIAIASYSALGLAILFFVLTIGRYFWIDPPLSLQAQQALIPPEQIADAENGALYALGITAQGDPYAAGLAYATAHNAIAYARSNGNTTATLPMLSTVLGSPTLAKIFANKSECDLTEQQCLKAYQAKASYVRTIQYEHATLLNRYEKLQTYPQYQNPLDMEIESPFAEYNLILQAARVMLMEVAIDIADPSTQADAMQRLYKESNYWRNLLRQSRSLVEKGIATRMITEQLNLANEIISTYPETTGQYAQQLNRVTAPLSKDEMSLNKPILTEFIVISKVTLQLRNQILNEIKRKKELRTAYDYFLRIFYKPQASVNLQFEYTKTILAKQSLTAAELLALQGTEKETPSYYVLGNTLQLNNIIGSWLAYTGHSSYTDFFLRVHDLDARLRLAQVHRLIALNKVSTVDISQFITKLGPTLWDPYTQAPITWQPDSRTLRVETHSTSAKKFSPSEIRIAP
jgi:hypothetical protein